MQAGLAVPLYEFTKCRALNCDDEETECALDTTVCLHSYID